MDQNPSFGHGNHSGKNEKNDSTPMSFMWMKSWDEVFHRVDDIRDFAVINPKNDTLLDTRHIAHLLFEFKEDRLVASQEILLIRNVVGYRAVMVVLHFSHHVFLFKALPKKERVVANKPRLHLT